MNRSLKLSMLLALVLGSSPAFALDLGQVQVKSALGQPLLAEIPLHPADAAELKNLTVKLASGDEFQRAGIVGGRTTIPLHFAVASTAAGTKVIRITSTEAVDDPYLDLLIEVNGSAGKSVREFAILLDPPGTGPAPVAAVAAAATRPAAPRVAPPAPAAKPATARIARPAVMPPAVVAGNGQYGPVAAGQTLSGIARSTAPAGVDVQQMMLALKQANPDAFYRDNINALKRGAVLRVPTAAQAQAMSLAAAIAEVRRQNSDWRASATRKPAVVADAATRAKASSSPGGHAGTVEDRLALVPPKEGGAGSQGNNVGGKGKQSVAGLRQDLLRAQESVASLQQQSNDLKSRLKDLTDINGKNERLLSLKDNEIAALQNKLAEARKAASTQAAAAAAKAVVPTVVTRPEASPAKAASAAPAASGSAATTNAPAVAATAPKPAAAATASAPAVASTAAAPAPAVAKVATPPVRKPAAKPVVKPAPRQTAETPWYMQPWAWAAGAAALLLLILLGLRGRKGKSPAKAAAARTAPSLADRFSPAALPEGDDASHADIDQDELLDQLAEHPDDIDLHLELVALYYSRRDVERFEAAAEAMHAHITDPNQDEWQDVVHMGEDLVPGHPLFDHHPEAAVPEGAQAHHAFDIDDYGHEHDAPTVVSSVPPPSSGPKKVSEYSFNFDLTQPAPGDSAQAHHATAADEAATAVPHPLAGHAEPASGDGASRPAASASHGFAEDDHSFDITEFSDDPVDTKLDLARAYVDMGDADGARAMLGEVIKEGSQTQQDVARRLLDTLR
ncbi:MAG: fimbrial protein FimV [Xanthomonadaceae bacterium]|jgi:pilus assembly protein FimV|nr:fimbrial protein FimV [Xanthomonadaceae bacterium]